MTNEDFHVRTDTMIKAHIMPDPIADCYKLRIIRWAEDGKGHPYIIEELPGSRPGMEVPVAIETQHTKEFVQAIMNAGWEAGMRPHGYKDEASSITRIEDHLADMQRLVFDATPKEKK